MIQVKGLTKSYGPHKAIDQVSFHVAKGEVVGFLGPNGAGKSTTMKIITGFMAPTEGQASVAGFDVFENPIEVKKRIGYLPEIPPLYLEMRVEDYLKYVAQLKGVGKTSLHTFVNRAIEKTNLGEVRKRYINHLSKGFRQRVGIAQALVSNPEVLILDEPTVGLDPKQVAEIRKLIQDLKGHHTIVLSTHILPEVQATCERLVIIHKGRVVAEDTLTSLETRMKGSRKVVIKVAHLSESLVSEIESLQTVLGVRVDHAERTLEVDLQPSDSAVSGLAETVVQSKAGLLELTSERVSLEDIFLKLTYDQNHLEASL